MQAGTFNLRFGYVQNLIVQLVGLNSYSDNLDLPSGEGLFSKQNKLYISGHSKWHLNYQLCLIATNILTNHKLTSKVLVYLSHSPAHLGIDIENQGMMKLLWKLFYGFAHNL